MFDKLNKNQKIIVYFIIGISFIFIIPILFWIGFFIGYNTCKNSMELEMTNVLNSESEKDDNYLEITL